MQDDVLEVSAEVLMQMMSLQWVLVAALASESPLTPTQHAGSVSSSTSEPGQQTVVVLPMSTCVICWEPEGQESRSCQGLC